MVIQYDLTFTVGIVDAFLLGHTNHMMDDRSICFDLRHFGIVFRHRNHPEFWAYAASAPEFTCRILQEVKLQVRGPNL